MANIIMSTYLPSKKYAFLRRVPFGLDSSSVKIEKFPMVLHIENMGLTRVKHFPKY
jgi:KUP system potassium uptake protein